MCLCRNQRCSLVLWSCKSLHLAMDDESGWPSVTRSKKGAKRGDVVNRRAARSNHKHSSSLLFCGEQSWQHVSTPGVSTIQSLSPWPRVSMAGRVKFHTTTLPIVSFSRCAEELILLETSSFTAQAVYSPKITTPIMRHDFRHFLHILIQSKRPGR